MSPEELRQLNDEASKTFKEAQKLKGKLPEGVIGVTKVNLTEDQIDDLLSGEGVNLAESRLSHPHSSINTTIDLIKLLNQINHQVRNPSLILTETFLTSAMILAANLGATRDILSIPIIGTNNDLTRLANTKNLHFKPGARVIENIGLETVVSLNATGMGQFMAVEQNTSAYYRLYHLNLARLS